MSQNKTHQFTQFVLWATAALLLMGVDVYSHWTGKTQDQTVDIAASVRQMTGLPVTTIQNFVTNTHSHDEFQRLLQDNERLSAQLITLQSVEQDNIELKHLLNLTHHGITPVTAANILVTAGGIPAARLVIDKGSEDGIIAGQAVIDGYGLIGQITSVGKHYAQITPSNHRNSVIPVVVARTGYRTLIYGTSEYLDLRYFPADQDIVEGDILLTSGVDASYPAGIPVANVTYIDPTRDGSPYLRVRTEFIGHISSARFVMILPRNTIPSEVVAMNEQTSSVTETEKKSNNKKFSQKMKSTKKASTP